MTVMMRIVQQFQPAKRAQFMELERQFAALERSGALPRGERMIPISGRDPGNTLIWQCRFTDLSAAQAALRLMESSSEHTQLADQQLSWFYDSWVELYEILEY